MAFFAISAAVFLFILVLNILYMCRDRNLHLWPSVTRCRICDKRIFVWQRHERRDDQVVLDNPSRLVVSVHASSIVHKSCKGAPVSHVKMEKA